MNLISRLVNRSGLRISHSKVPSSGYTNIGIRKFKLGCSNIAFFHRFPVEKEVVNLEKDSPRFMNILGNQWPNLKNLSGGLNLSRGLNMVGST